MTGVNLPCGQIGEWRVKFAAVGAATSRLRTWAIDNRPHEDERSLQP